MTTDNQSYSIAVPVPLRKDFAYKGCGEPLHPGMRVLVPFAGRKLVGVVLGPHQPDRAQKSFKLKKVIKTVEETPLYSQELLDLAKWLSSYYHYPIGEVLKAMIPGRDAKTIKKLFVPKKELIEVEGSLTEKSFVEEIFKKKKSLTEATVLKKLKSSESGGLKALKLMIRKGFIEEAFESKTPLSKEFEPEAKQGLEQAKDLTTEQSQAISSFRENLTPEKPWKPFLLHGVTGSGKTEVYLHMIAEILQKNPRAQILVMVPEISLTPQMTGVFAARFLEKFARFTRLCLKTFVSSRS